MASRSLSELSPLAREKCLRWIDGCKEIGIDVLVYCTYRAAAEQDELYKQGRETSGRKVTNAKGGDSLHQYRCAWDAVPLKLGKPQWGDSEAYLKMGQVAEKLGIDWAGRWKSFRETAHFQFTNGLTLADFKAGKVLA